MGSLANRYCNSLPQCVVPLPPSSAPFSHRLPPGSLAARRKEPETQRGERTVMRLRGRARRAGVPATDVAAAARRDLSGCRRRECDRVQGQRHWTRRRRRWIPCQLTPDPGIVVTGVSNSVTHTVVVSKCLFALIKNLFICYASYIALVVAGFALRRDSQGAFVLWRQPGLSRPTDSWPSGIVEDHRCAMSVFYESPIVKFFRHLYFRSEPRIATWVRTIWPSFVPRKAHEGHAESSESAQGSLESADVVVREMGRSPFASLIGLPPIIVSLRCASRDGDSIAR